MKTTTEETSSAVNTVLDGEVMSHLISFEEASVIALKRIAHVYDPKDPETSFAEVADMAFLVGMNARIDGMNATTLNVTQYRVLDSILSGYTNTTQSLPRNHAPAPIKTADSEQHKAEMNFLKFFRKSMVQSASWVITSANSKESEHRSAILIEELTLFGVALKRCETQVGLHGPIELRLKALRDLFSPDEI